MNEISLLSKNAYFSLFISNDFIYSHLAYSHYDLNQSYILRDVGKLPKNISEIDMHEFWNQYFSKLEEKWKWKILSRTNSSKGTIVESVEPFKDENMGVSGCSMRIVKDNGQYTKIFESLRKFSLDFKIFGLDRYSEEKIFKKIFRFLKYEDGIFLNLNSQYFRVHRFEKDAKIQSIYDEHTWESIKDLMKMIQNSKYNAFLSKYINRGFMFNIWANFLTEPVLKTNSEILKDFVRGYITVQLLSIFNSNSKISKDFGLKKAKNIVYLTGDLVKIPEFREILISVIDGLQLKGNFDFCIDISSLAYTFGNSFVRGVKAKDMILIKDTFLPNFTKVFIPEIDLKKGERKLIFTGYLKKIGEEKREEYSIMSTEFNEILVDRAYDSEFEGKFTMKAGIEHFERDIEFKCFEKGISWNRVVFDTRFKPVVYGPGPKENNLKFNMWFTNEFNT